MLNSTGDREHGQSWHHQSSQRTPGYFTSRNRRFREQLQKHPEDFSSEFVNKTWTLHKVMEPLLNAKFEHTDIRILEKHLRLFINGGKKPRIDTSNSGYKVKSWWISGQLPTPNTIYKGLFINISHANLKTQFMGILCDVDSNNQMHDHEVFLRLFLTNGTDTLRKLVATFLEKRYRCKISSYSLSPLELSWCAAIWAHVDKDIPMKNFRLKYLAPTGIHGISTVTLTVLATDINHLWESIHDANSDEFNATEVQEFFKSLQEHIFKLFRIKLEAFSLQEVVTSHMVMNHKGKLKIYAKKNVLYLLRHLTSSLKTVS